MRMIGTIPHADAAERFSDYLLASGVENMVEEKTAGGEWSVWIEHDDDIDRGKNELAAFLTDPANSRYHAASRAQTIRKEQQKQQERRRRKFIDVRTRWGQPGQWNAPLTLTLIALSIVLSFATGSIGFGFKRPALLDRLRFVSANQAAFARFQMEHPQLADRSDRELYLRYWLDTLRHGEVWRLITPIFLHFNLLHLLFNLFWTRDLGGMIELRRGTWRLLGIVLISAIISNLAQYLYAGPIFGGMSGVVYALFGYVWIKGRYQPHLGIGINSQTAGIMIAWLVLCMTGLVGPIANAAHVAGLIVGAAVAYLPYQASRWRRGRGR
jgi:GlpG protein